MRLNHRFFLLPLLLGATFLGQGCGGASSDDIDNGFESDDPQGDRDETAYGGMPGAASDSKNGAPQASPSAPNSGSNEATRAVEEADIIQTDGNRLYALSKYGGLAIVDTTNPDQLRLLGRKRMDAMPFEMYVRDGRAYVMLNDFGHYERSEGSMYGRWVQSSEILALDVRNPAQITQVAAFDVPGDIADSRLVGDALYLVTYENGSCWRCAEKPGTIVTSFSINGGITKVDQLPFTSPNAGYSSWKRSVSATNERLYVAGPEWSWNGGSGGKSVIQVVDIKDPTGKLHKGADIPVAGQIQSRWQMDEYQGVLRVVSQFGNGWGNGQRDPQVETFAIASSDSFTKLGQTNLRLPQPESLRSVRFDGLRGYAITAEQKDPLYTIDLSNPAAPKQAGELHMPGWITHLEPRGDRLVGFGFEDTNWSSKLAVSLFDVSNMADPKLLSRVAFGAGSGQYAEDKDRIHKSVRVLDDKGLVLVPFASYGSWNGGSCAQGQSGIQLIDMARDSLTLRGIAPQHGQPRRAIVMGDRMLGVSDRNVTTFDIANRAAPVKKAEMDLANPAYRMTPVNGQLASITNDWWTSEVMLSLTPRANADDADVTGKVSLASLAEQNANLCSGRGGAWAEWYSARLFTQGNHVIVTVPVRSYTDTTSSGKLVVGVVDASNPAAPVLVSKSEIAMTTRQNGYGGYWGFFDGYGYYSYFGGSLVSGGESIVQVGNKLAYIENDTEYAQAMNGFYVAPTIHRKLHVVDLANVAAPVVAAPVILGDSLGSFPLNVQGNTVLSSRWVRGSVSGKVKFYVDRVDLGGAMPARLPSVNTPGSLVTVDATTGRYVTADYTKSAFVATSYQDCSARTAYRGRFDQRTLTCKAVDRNFKLVDVDGTRLTVRNTFTPPSQNLGGLTVSDDRIYVTHYPTYDYSAQPGMSSGVYVEPKRLEAGGLWSLGGLRDGRLRVVNELEGDSKWPLAAAGSKVALYTDSGLAIYDTATEGAAPRLVADAKLRGWGYSSHVLLEQDRATCSLGEWGIQTVALRP